MQKKPPKKIGNHSESQFENKVFSGLEACGIDTSSVSEKTPLGLAVSGGADSVSLLLSLSEIFESSSLRVITVDHGIRSEEESVGDADFVRELCGKLGIFCYIEKIPHGRIEGLSKESSLSLEAVARNLRYETFDSFVRNQNLLALCLAHNQNDQCETVLMRFLQGSGAEGLSGIARVRGKYVRPLLDISRSEIEQYLCEKNQSWRTDSTNSDTKYLRNRIRNVLIPVLNENFVGWQKGLLTGAKKSASDDDFLCGMSLQSDEKISLTEKSSLKIDRSYFYSLHPAIARRIFFDSLNKIDFGGRFPYRLFEEILSWSKEKSQKISFENVQVLLDSENLVIEIRDKNLSGDDSSVESGFCFVFKNDGDCAETEDFLIRAEKAPNSENALLSFVPKNPESESFSFDVSLPFLVRSPLPGDEIRTSLGELKSLSDIFSDWKVPPHLREKALVVEILSFENHADSYLKALLASHLAFKNWIVEDAKL